MTTPGNSVTSERLQVRLVLDYRGNHNLRALKKWIPDALDRYFNEDKPGQMYVDEIAVEPAEPVPPVPEVRCSCGRLKDDPIHGASAALHSGSAAHGYTPAEWPAEGTESDVSALLQDCFDEAAAIVSPPDAYHDVLVLLEALVQRQRAEAVREDRAASRAAMERARAVE